MRLALLFALALTSCGPNIDRLSDEQAGAAQNIAVEPPIAVDPPLPPQASPPVSATYDGLAGTKWVVTAINGRPTPGGAGYFVHFTESDIAAKFGCNSIGGGYRLNGDHLSTSDLAQTEMACPGPAMTVERLGGAVLSSNMRVERISGERLRLVSEAGSIDLQRAP